MLLRGMGSFEPDATLAAAAGDTHLCLLFLGRHLNSFGGLFEGFLCPGVPVGYIRTYKSCTPSHYHQNHTSPFLLQRTTPYETSPHLFGWRAGVFL